MALSPTDIAAIETMLAEQAEPVRVIGDLRGRFPGLAVTSCDPSDVDLETPFRTWPHVALFLVNNSNHCWTLTSEPASATGLLVVPQTSVP
jgi:hypothetical protein